MGKNGQVGSELQVALKALGDVIALDRNGTAEYCGDLANLEGLRQAIRLIKPDIIVNAAAYTAVDKAESEPNLAKTINTDAVRLLAEEAKTLGALLVHYSTDYVFDGSGTKPWVENDVTGPLSIYGKTKLDGEKAIVASGCKYLIFRTSWVYGKQGNNFAKTILWLAGERESLNIINDQFGAPTGADLIAEVTVNAIEQTLSNPQLQGLYHLAPQGECSWYDYANLVMETAKSKGVTFKCHEMLPIPAEQYSTTAKRPQNSRLDTTKFTDAFGMVLPYWEVGVTLLVNGLIGTSHD